MNQIYLTFKSESQEKLGLKRAPDKYLKPCCCWTSSTKVLLNRTLVENRRKISLLKSSMEVTENTFKLENPRRIKPGTLNLSTPLIFKKILIHKIIEVDENLTEDELYPQIAQSSASTLDDCTKATEESNQILSHKNLEIENPFGDGTNKTYLTELIIDEDFDDDSDDEKKSALKSFSKTVGNKKSSIRERIRSTTAAHIQDLLPDEYKRRQNQIFEKNSQQLRLEPIKINVSSTSLPKKSELYLSSRRQALMERLAKKK